MSIRALKFLAVFLALTLITPFCLLAQSGTNAALSGTVTDATGAVLRGATVTLTFVATGAQRITLTGQEGGFLFLQLSTGDYRVQIQAPGFAVESQQIGSHRRPAFCVGDPRSGGT